MNFSELIPLAACLVNLTLTLFVFSRDVRATMNRVYLLWGISLTVWNLGVYFMLQEPEGAVGHAHALFWAKFLQFGVIFLPISLFHLGLLIAGVRVGRVLPLLYAFQICWP